MSEQIKECISCHGDMFPADCDCPKSKCNVKLCTCNLEGKWECPDCGYTDWDHEPYAHKEGINLGLDNLPF